MSAMVRKLRLERGWTQEHLAQLTGLSVRSIQRIERGQSCSLETQSALAAVFGVARSVLNLESSLATDVAPVKSGEAAAIGYVKSLRGFLSHVFMFLGLVVVVGSFFGFDELAIRWGAIGWMMGILAHGLTSFDVISVFSPDWERKQVEKRLVERRQGVSTNGPPAHWVAVAIFGTLVRLGRASMKMLARVYGSTALVAGVALLAWVMYDATDVMRSLGLQSRMDEATVALLTLLMAALLIAFGVFALRRIRQSPTAASV